MNPKRCSATIYEFRFLMILILTTSMLGALQNSASAAPLAQREDNGYEDPAYIEAIQRTTAMAQNPIVQQMAGVYGLNVVNVTWEDTGRYKGSTVGPNISDATIQVQHRDPISGQYLLSLMPIIRYPNYSDLSADISPDRFYLLVGNQKDEPLHKVSLREYLGNLRDYLHEPNSWAGRRTSLLAERDSHVLVSAQAASLPIPKEGMAEFNPVLFNYQSYQGDPAVLVIVATREGTSATIIDNVRDAFPAGFSWGQRLFFNQDGERASLTGQRLSDFTAEEGPSGETPKAANESGLNMVLIIQVPLKQKQPLISDGVVEEALMLSAAPASEAKSDVETAVIGHGAVDGPFTEIDGLDIERDKRFPIRVTVQFYKATSNGEVSDADMQEIAEQIQRVYQEADYAGSLVVDGETGRPTEYEGPKDEPENWWELFWQRYEQNLDMSREQAIELWSLLKMNAGKWLEAIER